MPGIRFLVGLALLAALSQSPGALQPPVQAPSTFRAGANYVRADVYVTRDGAFVPDLTRDDFELIEDGAPQQIEKLEVITASARRGDVMSMPRTLAESRTLIETSRGRLFVIFLDTAHVDWAASFRTRQPLAAFLDRTVGADDLVAVMTPEMSASDLTFERRGDTVERVLAQRWPWGQRDAVNAKDPVEDQYWRCYPGSPAPAGCASDVNIASEMIARRREKRTLDALTDLVNELDTLRDERKTVVALTNGWLLYRPDTNLTRPIGCQVPGPPPVRVDPLSGRPTIAPQQGPASDARTCDSDRRLLASLDDERTFREISDRANRANVSFYTLDPRGAAVFDEPVAQPNGPALGLPGSISPAADRARLAGRQSSLRELAETTDGIAILNQSNLDAGFKRIAADLSGYYLLGYYSTGKLDGRFHAIRVRVKRPGVEVRARRGYLAPTTSELSRATAVPASSRPVAAPAPATLTAALAGLAPLARNTPLRVALLASSAGGKATVWVQAELDPQLAPSESDVNIAITDSAGNILATRREHLPKETRSFRSGLAPGAAPAGGQYTVRVRLQSANGDWDAVTATDSVAAPGSGLPASVLLGRRGPSTGNRVLPAADRRFRRSEILVAEIPLPQSAALVGRVLDRTGGPLPLPVAIAERRDDSGAFWTTAQISLNPLAPGDYVLELRDAIGETRATAFRVVP